MIYYTADLHFGHAKIVENCQRPFSNVEEMNQALIANWNRRVGETDTIYILGDLFFRCPQSQVTEILGQLQGQKRLITGNHDPSWMGKVSLERYFLSVEPYREETVDGRHLTLCHYPLLTWSRTKTGYMIHGHIHGSTHADFWPLLCVRDNVLNAGVDINGYAPVTFEELLTCNRAHKESNGGKPCLG